MSPCPSKPVALSLPRPLTLLLAAAWLAALPACSGNNPGADDAECGNALLEDPEVCDGFDLGDETCGGLGFSGGFLACAADCTQFDTTGCNLAVCGDTLVEGVEQCDGANLAGQSCTSLGYTGGALDCRLNCTFDTSDCLGTPGVCGNNTQDGNEKCDGSDLDSEDCLTRGFDGGTLGCLPNCTGFDTSACTGTGPECGDNVAQGDELCDGTDLKDVTCQSAGGDPPFTGGQLACGSNCNGFVVTGCTTGPSCGNDDAETGEVCDGTDLKGQNCVSQGFDSGRLECAANCLAFDTAECVGQGPECGNNAVEGSEACDGSSLAGKTCVLLGFTGGVLQCSPTCTFNTAGCTGTQAVCGNNSAENLEVCDGTDLRQRDCQDAGFDGGTLACTADCTQLVVSGCFNNPECGNGAVESGEQCDGANLDGTNCRSLSFDGGTLRCSSGCQFDTSDCSTCGNDDVETGELCDGTDLGGRTCVSQGFSGGQLGCNATCSALVTSACTTGPACGDGAAQGSEQCDQTDLRGTDCQDLGFTSGTLACGAACTFNTTGCIGVGSVCGDAEVEGLEVCDGANLDGHDCPSEGFTGGSLGCASDCLTFNVGACTGGSCGDGVRQTGEECDGTSLGGASCTSLGFSGGVLTCASGCTYDTSACTTGPVCGNRVLEGAEQCDDTNLDGKTCASFGFVAGDLACDAQCRFDTSDCSGTAACGNGTRDGTEVCDGTDLGGKQCSSFGFSGGTLACNPSCAAFVLSACTGGTPTFCGDGVPGTDLCDGQSFAVGPECEAVGLGAGVMTCAADCTLDTSGCAQTDLCDALNYYNDGLCDPCEQMGGAADPDCANCGVAGDGCIEYHTTGGYTCQMLGTPDPDCGTCGNAAVEPNELCDGVDNDFTCEDGGYSGGSIGCTSTCELNFAGCTAPACGDGVGEGWERCDGADIGTAACRDFGFASGTLSCNAACTGFDTAGCTGSAPACCEATATPGCADATVEACVCALDDYCCTTAWDSFCVDEVTDFQCGTCSAGPACGNDLVETGEACDGQDLASETCSSLGFLGGTLTCDDTCTFDTSACTGTGPACGNNLREGQEACDGTDVGGQACTDFGFGGGSLGCTFACDALVFTACTGTPADFCGDGVPGLAWCDGTSFSGGAPSCELMGLGSGTVSCDANCDADFSGCGTPDLCEGFGWYGDGICDPCEAWGGVADFDCVDCALADGACIEWASPEGYTCALEGLPDPDCGVCGDGTAEGAELCDGSDVFVTCEDLGYAGGSIAGCLADCTPDLDLCTAPTCGDGSAAGWEYCDGPDLGGLTCASFGFAAGQLTCSAACNGWDTSACTGGGAQCGNGQIEPGETCDGQNLGGQNCQDFGFNGGTLACNTTCDGLSFDGCTGGTGGYCGDGVPDLTLCDGDGWRLGGPDCALMGMGSGTATCNPDCTADFSGCSDPTDFCLDLGWYGDFICDPCELLGGTPDPDCALCGDADGLCVSYTGYYGPTCDRLGTPDPDCTCGDAVQDPGEFCDGQDLGGYTCADFGYEAGSLSCQNDCSPNFSACVAPACGNGAAEGWEYCDGQDLAGLGCADFGFSAGTLACDAACNGFDTSACSGGAPLCGNDILEGNEPCDGPALGGTACEDLGFTGGTLTCATGCTFDTSACSTDANISSCGDGVANGLDYCEGTDFWGVDPPTCGDLLFNTDPTPVTCAADCTYDVQPCVAGAPDVCTVLDWRGDGICDPCAIWGGAPDTVDCTEMCAADATCGDYWYDGRSACLVETGALDPDCGTCGDGVAEGAEWCDQTDLVGTNCQNWGYLSGTLACDQTSCQLDFGGCTGDAWVCGDGNVDPFEACDGTQFDGATCADFGLGDGVLACDSECTIGLSACAPACCDQTPGTGGCAEDLSIESCVCADDPYCCDTEWDEFCVAEVTEFGCGLCASALCGDGVSGTDFCDGTDYYYGSNTCATYSLGSGNVTCSDCLPNFAACSLGSDLCAAYNWYGDGVCDICALLGGGEDTDCTATLCGADSTCAEWYFQGMWSCEYAGFGRDPDCGTCGDGIADAGEICDGTDGLTACTLWGYTSGTTACLPNCTPDFAPCN